MPSVLVVGGGLVGLSASLCLHHHGIDHVLVERAAEPSPLPRSRGLHTRSVEIFRQLGVEDRVQAAGATALRMGRFGGARTGRTLGDSAPLEMGLGRPDRGGGPLGQSASPSHFCFCPQVVLEPVLRDIARERGADLRFGTELTAFAQHADHVGATLTDRASGRTETLRADYLIAADGAASGVRTALGIASTRQPPTHHYLNLFFRADLTELVRDATFSQCEIRNERVAGLFAAKNNTDEWTFHLEYDPAAETPADYPDARCLDLIRAAIGPFADGLGIELLARGAWDTGTAVADEYRRGRIFLAGDAAHRHAPWGGFGANTGIADAHNLAWKLAAVLEGRSREELLDTYRPERRPRAVLAVEQARLRTEFLTRYGVPTKDNADVLARHLDTDAVMTRYRHTPDGREQLPVEALTGQSGTRFPHVPLQAADGRTLSTLDLFGRGWTLLTGSTAWDRAAKDLPLAVRRVGGPADADAPLRDPEGAWAALVGLPEDGALLVRPDGFVAARSDDGPLSPATLGRVLREVSYARA
ncbi:FAD-dependent monooxygenase [Streptomyces sp. PTM05]|uniref:FAD-dependent monooxygenase n=1 Tax=Streptantibioticus parmotrematis TaxID=2873249 RepID=A0ABS7R3V0_9ACTN|nr:FAD-dependent monooxygenase [Streptantibioticus parmotrematis]MBY8888719.1 FAD-dependent monooxygenase [Streptantibioticus parmotrematis]